MMDLAHGNCYTFNYNQKYVANRAGSEESMNCFKLFCNFYKFNSCVLLELQMQFYVNQSDYLSSTVEAGMYLVVHDQDRTISFSNMGSEVPTGELSSMSLRRVRFTIIFIYFSVQSKRNENTFNLTNFLSSAFNFVILKHFCRQQWNIWVVHMEIALTKSNHRWHIITLALTMPK